MIETFARKSGHDPVDDRDILCSLTLTLPFTLSGYSILFLSILTHSISQCKCRHRGGAIDEKLLSTINKLESLLISYYDQPGVLGYQPTVDKTTCLSTNC